MLVPTPTAMSPVDDPARPPGTGPDLPPTDHGGLPARRTVLGLLATAGAAAAATRLAGLLVDAGTGGPSRVDPARALHLHVSGMTTDVDRAGTGTSHADHTTPSVTSISARTEPHGAETDGLGDRVWSRLVTVSLVVRNTAPADVLFSPGQVRLRLSDGTSVMPVDSERPAGPVGGLTSTRTWVRYLAPTGTGTGSVEYTPAGDTRPVPLVVVPGEPAAHGRGAAR